MRNESASALERNNLEQLPNTETRNSESPCVVCVEQRECSATSQTERKRNHELLAQYKKAA